MLKGRDTIIPKLRWLVGDGSTISIREDIWLPIGKIGGIAAEGEPVVVADLLDSSNAEWKADLITTLFDAQVSEVILNIPINPSLLNDQLVWTATSSGDYTVKSYYHYVSSTQHTPLNIASSSYQNPIQLWRKIWHMKIAPKIRVFMWLACKNAIATKANLYQRHISPNPYCTLCNHNVPETIKHLFFFCTHYKVRVSISPTSVRRFDEWVAARAIISKASPDFEVLANLLWEIWRQRNNAVFRQQNPDPIQAVENALAQSRILTLLDPLMCLHKAF